MTALNGQSEKWAMVIAQSVLKGNAERAIVLSAELGLKMHQKIQCMQKLDNTTNTEKANNRLAPARVPCLKTLLVIMPAG